MQLDAVHDLFDHVDADRPLLTGSSQAIENLETVEGLSSSILLHNQGEGVLCPLARGKPFMAAEALPSTPNGVLVLSQAGVDDFTLGMATKGTFH